MSETDRTAILAQCQRYGDAFNEANSSLMSGVFADNCIIHGSLNGEDWIGDPVALGAFCDANPPGKESGMSIEADILGLSGVSAAVRVTVRDYHGQSFTDFFAMQKSEGVWRVVGKAFS